MISSLFKNNIISYLIAVIVGLALWFFHFWDKDLTSPEFLQVGSNEFALSLKKGLIYSFIIYLSSGFLLNYMVRKYLFSYEPTNLFLLFFTLIFSFILPSDELLKFSFVVLGLCWVFGRLLTFNEGKKIENKLFNLGLVIGLLCSQNPFFIGLLFVVIQNISNIKRVSVREVFALLIGFILPLAYIVIFSILTENHTFLQSIIGLDWITPVIHWRIMVVALFMLVLSVLGYSAVTRKRSGIDINMLILNRNLFVSLVVLLLISIGSLFLFDPLYSFCLLAVPLSIFLSNYFTNSSSRFKELVFLLIFSLSFLLR